MKTVILIIMFGGQWQIAAVPADECAALAEAIVAYAPRAKAVCVGGGHDH